MLFKLLHPSVLFNFLTDRLQLYDLRVGIASRVLYKKSKKCKSAIEFIALCNKIFQRFPSKYVGWSIKPAQVNEEIESLLSKVSEIKVNTMLEIGTFNGGTLFLFARKANSNAKIISLDLPEGKFGGGYEKYKISFFSSFAQRNQHIFLIRTDSHLQSSYTKVKSVLKKHELDFLFIDGDHTYEGVKKDFQMYSPLVRKGGLIAFHDICIGPADVIGEVHKFWEEIKKAYVYEEVIHDKNQGGFGIGLLHV